MLALVNNEPKVLNLLDMLKYYIKHQEDVVTRRTKYDLNKAEERDHILQGLLIALDHIDEVIKIIRAAKNVAEAKEKEIYDISTKGRTILPAHKCIKIRVSKAIQEKFNNVYTGSYVEDEDDEF